MRPGLALAAPWTLDSGLCDSVRCIVSVNGPCWSGRTGRVGYALLCFAMLSSAVITRSLSMPVGRIRRPPAVCCLLCICCVVVASAVFIDEEKKHPNTSYLFIAYPNFLVCNI